MKTILMTLCAALLLSTPAMAQQPVKAAPAANAKQLKLKDSAALKGLRTEQTTLTSASRAIAPDSMTRPKERSMCDAKCATHVQLRARVALGEKIAAHAAQLHKEAAAAGADARTLSAIHKLGEDAVALEVGAKMLVGEDGSRAFDAGDGVSIKSLNSSDAQIKRLRDSLASTLGLVEPWISR